MKKKNHTLSSDQCIQNAFDAETGTLETSIKETAISFSLDSVQDSITAHNKVVSKALKTHEEVDLSGTKQITIYGPTGTVVKASPLSEGDLWVHVGAIPNEGILTLNMCVIRLSCGKDCHVVAV